MRTKPTKNIPIMFGYKCEARRWCNVWYVEVAEKDVRTYFVDISCTYPHLTENAKIMSIFQFTFFTKVHLSLWFFSQNSCLFYSFCKAPLYQMKRNTTNFSVADTR
jgi:hypothetical protein